MLAWDRDLDCAIEPESWYTPLQICFKGILNVSLVEESLKVLNTWYLVLSCLARMFPNATPDCFRGCSVWGTMLLIWLECPKISGYLNRVFSMLCKVTAFSILQQPHITLLNDSLPTCPACLAMCGVWYALSSWWLKLPLRVHLIHLRPLYVV